MLSPSRLFHRDERVVLILRKDVEGRRASQQSVGSVGIEVGGDRIKTAGLIAAACELRDPFRHHRDVSVGGGEFRQRRIGRRRCLAEKNLRAVVALNRDLGLHVEPLEFRVRDRELCLQIADLACLRRRGRFGSGDFARAGRIIRIRVRRTGDRPGKQQGGQRDSEERDPASARHRGAMGHTSIMRHNDHIAKSIATITLCVCPIAEVCPD